MSVGSGISLGLNSSSVTYNSWVTLGTWLNLSVPQITHVYNGGHNSTHLGGLKELMYVKCLE